MRPALVEHPPPARGAAAPEPSFAYTDLRGIGKVDIDDLLDYREVVGMSGAGIMDLLDQSTPSSTTPSPGRSACSPA